MPATILRPYFLQLRNHYRSTERSKSRGLKRDLLVFFVLGTIMLCIYTAFSLILSDIEEGSLFRQIIPTKLIELLCYSFFFLQLVSATIAASGNVFYSNRMDLLLATPISSSRLYLAKFLETFCETTFMLIIFICPIALAYLHHLKLHSGFLSGGVLILLPFLLIPTGLSFVTSCLFARLITLFWKRIYIFSFLLLLTAYFSLEQLITYLRQAETNYGGSNAIARLISLFGNPSPIWLPSRWASDLLSYYLSGEVTAPAIKLALLYGTALGSALLGFLCFDFFALSLRSASHLHDPKAPEARVSRCQKMPLRKCASSRTLFEVFSFLPVNSQLRAIAIKDLCSLGRDRAQALQLLIYGAIGLTYLLVSRLSAHAIPLHPAAKQLWFTVLASANILFCGFILTSWMTRLVYPSISLEGRAFWIMISGPIKLSEILLAKFCCWLPITLMLCSSILLIGLLPLSPSPSLLFATIYIGAFLSLGCVGLATGIGSMFASFEWESPNQISAGFGTLVLLLSSLCLVLVNAIPAALINYLLLADAAWITWGQIPVTLVLLAAFISIPAINICLAWLCWIRGGRALSLLS